MTADKPLTLPQRRVLDYVALHQQTTGNMPTRADIARHFGWKSNNSADQHLQFLQDKGFITISPGSSRNLRLTQAALDLLKAGQTTAQSLHTPAQSPNLVALPVINMGRVSQTWRAEKERGIA